MEVIAGGIALKVAAEVGLPPLVRLINRQRPEKRAEKWDARVEKCTLTVLGATPRAEVPADPDLDRFLMVAEE